MKAAYLPIESFTTGVMGSRNGPNSLLSFQSFFRYKAYLRYFGDLTLYQIGEQYDTLVIPGELEGRIRDMSGVAVDIIWDYNPMRHVAPNPVQYDISWFELPEGEDFEDQALLINYSPLFPVKAIPELKGKLVTEVNDSTRDLTKADRAVILKPGDLFGNVHNYLRAKTWLVNRHRWSPILAMAEKAGRDIVLV